MLEHELLVRDFRAAVLQHLKINGLEIEGFSFPPKPLALFSHTVTLRPDAYFAIIKNGEKSRFFLEVDRGTEKHHTLLQKIWFYRRFSRFNGFSKSSSRSAFRVLVLFRSEVRMQKFLANMNTNGVSRFVLAGKLENAVVEPLARIWRTSESTRIASGNVSLLD